MLIPDGFLCGSANPLAAAEKLKVLDAVELCDDAVGCK
jgi:hypothetical protein